MKRIQWIGMACISMATVCLPACDKDDDEAEGNNLSEMDRTFMMKAAFANRAEVELGQLASDKGNHAAVRDFGHHMVSDHNLALHELDSLGDRWNVDLPNGIDSLHQAKKQMLSGMTGYSFDTAYIHSQVKDHIEAIALFESEAAGGQEQRLKDYANKYLPHLRMHKTKIDSVQTVVEHP